MIKAELSLFEINVSNYNGEPRSFNEHTQYSLSLFSGGYLRARAEATFRLRNADSRMGEDIVIPLSKLHSVSGTVVIASDGRPADVAQVSLLYGDDEKPLATALVDPKTGEYRFYFVPEGHFILKVAGTSNVFKKAQNSATVLNLGPLEHPLDVNGDVDGVVLALPEPTTKPQTVTNSAQSQ